MKTSSSLPQPFGVTLRAVAHGILIAAFTGFAPMHLRATGITRSSSSGTFGIQAGAIANQAISASDLKPILFIQFDGASRSESFFQSIAREPLLAWGAVTATNDDGTTTTQPGEVWLITASGPFIHYHHLSDRPAPADSPTVNYHGYTILVTSETTTGGTQQNGSSLLISTTEYWCNYRFQRGTGGGTITKVTRPLSAFPATLPARSGSSAGQPTAKTSTAPFNMGGSLQGSVAPTSPFGSSKEGVAGATQVPISSLPAVLTYVGKTVETFDFYSSSDFSTQLDVYNAAGHLTQTAGMTALASSNGELVQQARDCSDLAQDIATGMGAWIATITIAGEALGGLFAAGAELLTGGVGTPIVLTGGVIYVAGLQSLALFHATLTVPMIAGLIEQQCLNGIAGQIEFADLDVSNSTVSPICMELTFVCDAVAVGNSSSSDSQEIEPADDADYEIVVTGHESVEILGCAEFHFEATPCY